MLDKILNSYKLKQLITIWIPNYKYFILTISKTVDCLASLPFHEYSNSHVFLIRMLMMILFANSLIVC